MKTFKQKNGWLSVLALTVLAACGDNPTTPILTTNPIGGVGNCSAPVNSYKERTVVGNLGFGATLTLDIYSGQAGTISAVGQLVIPSVSNLYGTNFLMQTPAAAVDAFKSCVSSNGAVGTLTRGNAYDDITLALQGASGANVYIEMGQNYAQGTYLVSNGIEGPIFIRLNGQQDWVFPSVRP